MNDGGQILPAVARDTVEAQLLDRPLMAVSPDGYLAHRAGVFVTIRNRSGDLRGCRGTIQAQYENVLEETRRLAVSSALHDTRFEPVRPAQLVDLTYEVSVLYKPEPVVSLDQFDPSKFGIIVYTGSRKRALMLPNVEGLDTVDRQYRATCQKGGIDPEGEVHLERFQVDKFIEEES